MMRERFTPEYIEHLAFKFTIGELTAEEQADFDEWYSAQALSELDLSTSEIENKSQLRDKIYKKVLEKAKIPRIGGFGKRFTLWPKIAAAAAAVTLFVAIGLSYYNKAGIRNDEVQVTTDVSPGRTGATLVLANGQKIAVDASANGRIASEPGINIEKDTQGRIVYRLSGSKPQPDQYNMLSTSRGQQVSVRLPDGSLVFLNAASSLKYPASFASEKKRIVELSGEGYFEIAKDKVHPFIVKTAKAQIEVLGTHFNINSYEEESATKTTLLEGSIKLVTKNQHRILKPTEQAVVNSGLIKISNVDTEEIVAWKNNEFLFKHDDFKTNMRKIARWYDIEVFYAADAPENFKLGGFLSRSRNLSAVLKLIEQTDQVHFRLEGRKLYISK